MAPEVLCRAFREMWHEDSPRSRTLARLVQHQRQIEQWWKCEVATHLWDYAEGYGDDVYVWLETFDRADITIATGTSMKGRLVPSSDGIVIPIEMKMVGTFWGRGNVEKAYREARKKTLERDMLDARNGRRPARPFAAVALLVTHRGARNDEVFQLYLRRARELGAESGLVRVMDEAIALPAGADGHAEAHQLLWTTAPVVSPVPRSALPGGR